MKFPLRSTVQIGKYVASQQRKGERYPLVLMLEPTLACNIACIGCGKIREYESNKARLSVDECIDAGVQCPAPVVSICGGEPLIYKGIEDVVAGMLELRKNIDLCTNALKLTEYLEVFKPDPRLTFVVHLDGMRATHDLVTNRMGVFDKAIEMIKEAKKRREAATAFADGGRQEMADKEVAEAAVLAEYLPEQLGAEEIEALVTATIADLGVAEDGMKAMGRVMGVITPQVRGRADGGAVAAEVRRQLG